LYKCCLEPRKDLLILDEKEKCPNTNAKMLNNYMLNKYQDPKKNFTIDFNNVKMQKALAKAAVSPAL
jgi:hypothetical protein